MMAAVQIVCKKSDAEDILKIREYNFPIHIKMMLKEIAAGSKKGALNCFRQKGYVN